MSGVKPSVLYSSNHADKGSYYAASKYSNENWMKISNDFNNFNSQFPIFIKISEIDSIK